MDIEQQLLSIIDNKVGNKEMALFYGKGMWRLDLGNPTTCVSLGEVCGEMSVESDSIEGVIVKMKEHLRK